MSSNKNTQPIYKITFQIGDNLSECYQKLTDRGFTKVEGDIRIGGGGKFCALGYKRIKEGTNNPYFYYITNILGVVSDIQMPYFIYENSIKYTMIIDKNDNGDINKGSEGFYIYLYYTTNEHLLLNSIKDLVFISLKEKVNSKAEMIQNAATNSIKNGILDINVGRGGSSPFNYIIIIR